MFDSEILALVKDEELEEEIAQADLFKERIYSTLIQIEKASAPSSHPPPPPTVIPAVIDPTVAAPTRSGYLSLQLSLSMGSLQHGPPSSILQFMRTQTYPR